jgi:hypothetical protein
MTFDRRRSELEARSLRRLDLPRVYHENQIAELDAHNLKKLLRQSLRGVRLAKRADPALDTNFLRPVKWLVYFTGNFCLFPLAAAGPQA